MTRKSRIIALTAALCMAALVAGTFLLAPRMLDPQTHRAELIDHAKSIFNRDVRFDTADFTLWPSPALTFTRVAVREKDSQADFITAERLHFKLSLLSLLRKKAILKEAVLIDPRIAVIREASGIFNITDLIDSPQRRQDFGIDRLRIQNGLVHFTDRRIAASPTTLSLERLNLRLTGLAQAETTKFSLSAGLVSAEKRADIALDGSIDIPLQPESFLNSRINTAVKLNGLDAGLFWPYYSRYVPFRKLAGRMDIDARFRGSFAEFESGGSVTLHDLHLDYPGVFPDALQPKTVRAVYDMKRSVHEISVTKLDVAVDGISVRGSCLLKDIQTDDLFVDARAVTGELTWETVSRYIPYGIIPGNVADFIKQKIRGGIFRLDEGRLYGRISQIAHMETGDNANVLHVRGRVQQGVLEYASDIPVFRDISGILELKGRDFNLHGMAGKFGEAPFSLEGKLADYCLDTPTRYPLSLKLTPGAGEVSWLFGKEATNRIRYAESSTLTLSGDGTLGNYKLSGSWDLTAAEYKYADWLSKPAGKANDLSFSIYFTDQETRVSSFRYNLLPLSLEASARYRYKGRRALALSVKTNVFQIRDLLPLLPKIEKFSPRGQVRLAVRGNSGPADLADLNWRGEVSLAGVSFKPTETMQEISRVTGKVRVLGSTLETSPMSVRLGGARLSVKAKIADIRNPVLSVTFASTSVDAADLGLRQEQQPVILQNVSGSVILRDRNLQIDALNFRLNDSVFKVKGAVRNPADQPDADLSLTSPYMDWRDVMILANLKRTSKTLEPATHKTNAALKADLQIDAGRMGGHAFRNLRTTTNFDRDILYLQAFTADALGGKLAGSGRIDLTDTQAPRYHFKFRLDKLSAQQCLSAMDLKEGIITGTLSATGDLTAKGGGRAELKKTALGHVRIQLEEGQLMKSKVLSRAFSMINESQLPETNLPDMAQDGMSYRRILAMLSFQDGIVSTNNLVVHAGILNISAVAAIDMPQGKFIDTTVAVQLLHTVGKVVSRIPVIGWILTDEKRSVMSVHFEVSGEVDNPTVKAVPVRSLARGVFDIFKNILQLPAKLFTDTGEVILGR